MSFSDISKVSWGRVEKSSSSSRIRTGTTFSEISIAVSDKFKGALDELMEGQEILHRKDNMVALTILFQPGFLQTPGILYKATRKLAWENINLTEIVSTMNELTFVIAREDSMKAYDVLESFFDEEL